MAQDVRIFHKECVTLAEHGYDVTLIAPYSKDERVKGVRVAGVTPARSRWERLGRVTWRVWKRALEVRGDVYHFHDPELIPVGLLLKLRGARVLYDVHEDTPTQTMSIAWLPVAVRWLLARAAAFAERLCAKVLDGLVAATPTIAARFPARKTVLVQNFPLLLSEPDASESDAQLEAQASGEPYARRANVALYLGGLERQRGVAEMVQAAALLPKDLNAQLQLAGKFESADVERELRAHPGWQRVEHLGWLSRGEVDEALSRARVGLVVLHALPKFLPSYPVKLFEYMAAGLPVVASDFPLWRRIIDEAGCGLLVNPAKPQEIADAITWLLTHPAEAEAMGRRGQHAVYARYAWSREAEKLLAFYHRLAPTSQGA